MLVREEMAIRGFEEWAPVYDETIAREVEQYGSIKYVELLKKLILWAELEEGMQVLDVGSGTGLLTIELARWIGDWGQVIGVDITEAMLQRGRENIEKAGLGDRIQLYNVSAMQLPFENARFDRVVSCIAMHHMEVPKALAEMVRVLKPGGMLVIADMGASPAWRAPIGRIVVPVLMFLYQLSRGFSAQAKAEVATFDQTYLPQEWEEMLAGHGLQDIRSEVFPHPTQKWYPPVLLMRGTKTN